jgi:dinuclear metal center YbgI/SA1388 family protein
VISIAQILDVLEAWAPAELAETWDNTGLLLGDRNQGVERVMTCLTITPSVVSEAVDRQASLIIPHHPLPFRPLHKLTTDHYPGRLLWSLASRQIAIASLHTRYDSAVEGINQQLAVRLGLREILPLVAASGLAEQSQAGLGGGVDPPSGRGRWGQFPDPVPVPQLVNRLKAALQIQHVGHVSSRPGAVRSVAIGCGSAGEFLADASRLGCDLLILGETNFHTCLEAQGLGVDLLLTGHYASERFALESLAERLAKHFPALQVWCSQVESDPLVWI